MFQVNELRNDARADWLDKVFRRSHSENSRHAAEMALRVFDKHMGESAEQVISKIKAGALDVYGVFDRFISKLDAKGASPNSISGYVCRVERYFAYNDVFVDRVKFRAKVVMPRIEEPDDRAPTVEELRRMLQWGKRRTKALMLVIASSGMRIGEVIKIKIKDVDFAATPVKIHLSPQVASKKGQARTVYISAEATQYLKDYLERERHGIADKSGWLFTAEDDENKHLGEDRAWCTIIGCIEKAGLGKEFEATACNRRKLHPYSLRKFFFSKTVGVIGETAAHALMGHGSYMKTYYRRSEQERAADYLKCMMHLTVMSDSADAAAIKKEATLEALRSVAAAYGIDPTTVSINKQRHGGKEVPRDEEIAAIQDQIRFKLKPAESPRKIIDESELELHLAQGWNVAMVLKSGRILVSKNIPP